MILVILLLSILFPTRGENIRIFLKIFLRWRIGILIGSFPRVYVPRFSDAIKFHGLDAILDWLAAWHTWPRSHVKFLTAGNWYLRRAVKLLVVRAFDILALRLLFPNTHTFKPLPLWFNRIVHNSIEINNTNFFCLSLKLQNLLSLYYYGC